MYLLDLAVKAASWPLTHLPGQWELRGIFVLTHSSVSEAVKGSLREGFFFDTLKI